MNHWRLTSINYNYEPVFNSILVNSISTLYDYEKQKRIIVNPLRDEFSCFENSIINVKYNPSYEKAEDKINLHIYNSDVNIFPNIFKIDDYNFQARLRLEKVGDYYAEAYIENMDIPEAKDYFRFYINENNFEYNETRAREDYLNRLSNFTGGKNLTNLDENNLKNLFSFEIQEEGSFQYIKNIYLNYNPVYIIIVILCYL